MAARRIGKVKIYYSEGDKEGHLIREGVPRETDFHYKLFGLFEPAELVRGCIGLLVVAFSVGCIWATDRQHFKSQDENTTKFSQMFSEFKTENEGFHKAIFGKLDEKETRINCLAESLKGCCNSAQSC